MAVMPETSACELDIPYEGLAPTANADFNRDGFVHLSGVLTPETIAQYEPTITSEVIRLNTQHLPLAERDTYGKAFLQVTNLWRENELVSDAGALASARPHRRRAARRARACASTTTRRSTRSPAAASPLARGPVLLAAVTSDRASRSGSPLQDTPLEMGPLAFARGSHNYSHGRDLPISDESEARLSQATAEQGFEDVIEPFALGDASFHRGWTFHHAGPNHGRAPRRVMTVIYMDADIRVAEPVNDRQSEDRCWMPGAEAGQIPRTPLNPVLYGPVD